MTREELLQALRRLKAETGSFVCLGCGHEYRCSTHDSATVPSRDRAESDRAWPLDAATHDHGCAVIKAAIREINILAAQNAALEEQTALARQEEAVP